MCRLLPGMNARLSLERMAVMSDTKIFNIKTLIMRPVSESEPRRHRARRCKLITNSFSTAEKVLDWVENHGGTHSRVEITGRDIVVRWQEGA